MGPPSTDADSRAAVAEALPPTYATGIRPQTPQAPVVRDLRPVLLKKRPMPQRPIRSLIARQKILTAAPETTVVDAARLMKKHAVGAVMVVGHDGRLAGIFTERDALFRAVAEGRDPSATRLADVMTPHPQTIAPDKPFAHALLMMYDGGFRHVPVVENGRPIGMVSARDALGPEIEEFESEMQRRTRIGEILG
jgi:CBS domain-containing protein